ncbi:MAG: sialate O-acetylesterase [Verrucomicrobiota bacterium]
MNCLPTSLGLAVSVPVSTRSSLRAQESAARNLLIDTACTSRFITVLRRALFLLVFLASASSSFADSAALRLFAAHGDHAVLQRDKPIPVRGWATPGEKVTVSFADHEAIATAGPDGAWSVILPALPASTEPRTLTARTAAETVTAKDILVGEVWFCSGQSNMAEFVKRSITAPEELARPPQPLIRHFRTNPKTFAREPKNDLDGRWFETNPTTLADALYTSVPYYFARNLSVGLGNIPVGVIVSAVGATRIDSWMSREALASEPKLARAVSDYEKQLAALDAPAPDSTPTPTPTPAPGVPTPAPTPDPRVLSKNLPTSLHNAQVAPLEGIPVRGFVWYQGEANRGDATYFYKMRALLNSWRKAWKQEDLPFLFVQIAPFDYKNRPEPSPEMWETQTRFLSVPGTAMVVTLDVGDLADIHPRRKREVGERLANQALSKVYHIPNIVADSPLYASHRVDGSTIAVTFRDVGSGLVSRDGSPLTWFTIAGADGRFVPAQAVIQGKDIVIVSSPEVASPVSVRFAWDNKAEPNLMSHEGLPAGSFRTGAPSFTP